MATLLGPPASSSGSTRLGQQLPPQRSLSDAAPWAAPGGTYATEPWALNSLSQPVPARYAAWPPGQQQQPQQSQFRPGWTAQATLLPPNAPASQFPPGTMGSLPSDHRDWQDNRAALEARGLGFAAAGPPAGTQ